MDPKAIADLVLPLARPIAEFHRELVVNGVDKEEATKITLEVFGFRRVSRKETVEDAVPAGTVRH